MNSNIVLHVDCLSKTYEPRGVRAWITGASSFTAVHSISFSLNQGEILGLLGPNGAGKTTTIQMLLGALSPSSGSIQYFGKEFFRHRAASLQKIGFASAYVNFPGRLTVAENLHVYGGLYDMPYSLRAERIERLLRRFDMWQMKDREVAKLSAGQKTRVMISKAFLPAPQILLLDEPTASLDPDVAHDVRVVIAEYQKEHGTAVLFTSHNMAEVAELCSRVLVLQAGQIIADDAPAKLAARVRKVHLRLEIPASDVPTACAFAQEKGLSCTVEGEIADIMLDEHQIAHFLGDLARRNIQYTHITITKPTLEDYFLSIARQSKRGALPTKDRS